MSHSPNETASPSMADEKGLARHNTGTDNAVGEVDNLTQLGYKREMTTNRSMLTLLFQSLAIAAVRTSTPKADLQSIADRVLQRLVRGVLLSVPSMVAANYPSLLVG